MRKPSRAQIARELGISPAAFAKYVAKGCPTYSVAAARAWRLQHIDPRRSEGQTYARDRLRASQSVATLPEHATEALKLLSTLEAAGSALGRDQIPLLSRLGELTLDHFGELSGLMRAALRCVPAELQADVQLPPRLWDRLLGPAFLYDCCRPPIGQAEPDTSAGATDVSATIFELAAGRLVYGEAEQ